MGVLAAQYPGMVSGLIGYLIVIVKCARNFKGQAWAQYDQVFRQRIAAAKDWMWSNVNTTLFNLCFAQKIFNAIADAMEWMAKEQQGSELWHYLDDYLTCGVAGSNEYAANKILLVLKRLCAFLGIPLAEDKVAGPATCLVLLGIENDTIKGEVRLPGPKLEVLVRELEVWKRRKRCNKHLLTIAGKLQHAATVVRSGRSFVRRLFDLSTAVAKPDHHLRLNVGAWSDLTWWSEYIADWNDTSLLQSLGELVLTATLTSDALGTWGCGAYWESKWIQLAWSDTVGVISNITVKELIPIVMEAAMWGKQWRDQVVNCRCDSMAVVAVIKSRASKESEIMHLLRCVAFIEARWEFTLVATHLAGRDNTKADDLSR